MNFRHRAGALMAALALSACAGGMIPPSAGGPAPSRPVPSGTATRLLRCSIATFRAVPASTL